ncbi:branched-chain amino acid ABC transporter permease [Deltaproteobacteria bacterium PRO3]|nr:branched-chain amino acid ABC transporter permease [Deltaproteobacteria bacterium PRO3]
MTEFFQQLVNGLAWGSIYALIALGYTMVYGVLRLINFAHGDVYMVGAMVGYYAARLVTGGGTFARFAFVMLSAMLVCALLGALIERLAYRPLRQAPRINALITAIGVSLFLEYFGQWLFGADPKFFPTLIETREVVNFHGVVVNNIQLAIFIVSFVLMFGLRFVVQKTKAGKAMRAVSFSHTASHLVGINVNRIISLTFVLGSVLAAAAGILVGLSNPKIDPLMGLMPGLKAFVAAVLGGIGNIPGALIGGLIMGVAETLVAGYISSTYRNALAFIILILILLFRPEGILGKSTREKV